MVRTLYQLTTRGGLEIIVHIGNKETFYIKKAVSTTCGKIIPHYYSQFEDAEPDEEEYKRLYLSV